MKIKSNQIKSNEIKKIVWITSTLHTAGGGTRLLLEGAKYYRSLGIETPEYKGKMPFGLEISVPYVEDSWRDGDDYFGVSLSMLVAKLTDYTLVTCGVSGVQE